MKTTIIAEAGVNHNGELGLAKKLVEIAKTANCDFVKFQSFDPDTLTTVNAVQAPYQKPSGLQDTETFYSQHDMLSNLTLSHGEEEELKNYCDHLGIGFLSTPFDTANLHRLIALGVPYIKIPSGEITNYPYLKHVSTINLPILLSTGMATMYEVADAMTVLKSGLYPERKITILQCTSAYPADIGSANLRVLQEFREKFGCDVGYSDHTEGIYSSLAAVALGATVIEKHFTLDKTLPGPDHKASLSPDELQELVKGIRQVESALGTGIKEPQPDEIHNLVPIRRSIVASRHIIKGELFSSENVAAKRPGSGLSPMLWNDVIGQVAKKTFNVDSEIEI
jgi:N,N'-diacetyllegionaminate synthase